MNKIKETQETVVLEKSYIKQHTFDWPKKLVMNGSLRVNRLNNEM